MSNNFLMVQAPDLSVESIQNPKSLHPQAPGFIRGVNLKSKI
jgi:hypothetical protein